VRRVLILLLMGAACNAGSGPGPARTDAGWEQSFRAGVGDESSGQPVGGTETVHLAVHRGRLHAGNGYWMDARAPKIPWAQVLVLSSRDGPWGVDRIIRIDPNDGHKATVELRIRQLLERSWGTAVSGSIIAAYSGMMPLTDPATGRTVHIIGVEGRIERGGKDRK